MVKVKVQGEKSSTGLSSSRRRRTGPSRLEEKSWRGREDGEGGGGEGDEISTGGVGERGGHGDNATLVLVMEHRRSAAENKMV